MRAYYNDGQISISLKLIDGGRERFTIESAGNEECRTRVRAAFAELIRPCKNEKSAQDNDTGNGLKVRANV